MHKQVTTPYKHLDAIVLGWMTLILSLAAIRPLLDPNLNEIEIDFSGVLSLAPSWVDEFFNGLEEIYYNKVTYFPSDNPSIMATMSILKQQAA